MYIVRGKTYVAFVAGVASDVSLAATHASLLVTAQVGDGALSVTRARWMWEEMTYTIRYFKQLKNMNIRTRKSKITVALKQKPRENLSLNNN